MFRDYVGFTRYFSAIFWLIAWFNPVAANEADVLEMSSRALTLSAAQDFQGASVIYQQLLASPLPIWQRHRVLYNLGNIQLHQEKWGEAFQTFQSISLQEVDDPLFLRNLQFNEGVSLLGQALFSPLSLDHLTIQFLWLQQSLVYFNRVQEIDCQLQMIEHTTASCLPLTNLQTLLEQTQLALKHNQQLQHEHLIKQVSSSQESSNSNLDQLIRHYRLAFLTIPLTPAILEGPSQVQKDEIPADVQALLDLSLEQLSYGQEQQSRYFLLAAIAALENKVTEQQNINDPKTILENSLQQAKRALELNLIYQMASFNLPLQTQALTILKTAQQQVVSRNTPFIQTVEDNETTRFQQLGKKQCQQFPWQNVIPSFEKGWQQAQLAQQDLNFTPAILMGAAEKQQKTIAAWQLALKQLQQPPQQSEQEETPQSSSTQAPADLNQTFHLLQEMQLEDSPPSPQDQELHAW